MTEGRLKSPLWLVPLAIAALVAVFGWWGNYRLRHSIEQQLRTELKTTLDANVTALETWMDDQKRLAEEVATEPRVRALAIGILSNSVENLDAGRPVLDQTEVDQFRTYLRPRMSRLGYRMAELVNTDYAVVASSQPTPNRGGAFRASVSEAQTNKYAEVFTTRLPVIITPYKPEFPAMPRQPGRGNRGRGGGPGTELPPVPGGEARGTNGPRRGLGQTAMDALRARRGDLMLMQVAAPIIDTPRDLVRGALAFVINPELEFTKILSVAGLGESGETYAFDQTGLLISKSKFEDKLRALGLLEGTNTGSALNVRLHDPGAAMVDNFRPLTHMVAEAVAGEDGVDVEPSRDYRGVQVVGAWCWLPQGFGVVTQIDADEAYHPLQVLKLLFTMLCLLLLLCATGMFVFSYSNFTWRRRLNEAELLLKQLGQYTLEEKIGEGGMGSVYRARHALMRRDTAVKLLTPDRADAAAVERFEREVCLTCQLTHPNTIQVYDYGHTPDGIFYYAMEFLRGLNLHELVARYGIPPEGRVVHILAQVCDSLTEAHDLGLVHRDIKPANIFLCVRGGVPDCVKVLDFGLVREYGGRDRERLQSAVGKGFEGTPWFMPPESIKDSRKADPRSDLYSVGALGYFLLTRQFVFDGETMFELCEKHLKETPLPPSRRANVPISPELDAVIMRCLAKDPADRPQTASELRDLLLATPHAADWTMKARSLWWAEYHAASAPKPGETEHEKEAPVSVAVSIDLGSRIQDDQSPSSTE